jgi:predicted nuclease with TOPRIM domain
MLDASTAYTLLAMALFIFLALIIVHQHNCAEQIRRKRGEVESVEGQLGERIRLLEGQVDDLKVKIEEVDEHLAVAEDQNQ